MVEEDESESANPFGFDFYDYFFSQIGNELSAMADAVTGTISSWFKSQKKEEKPVIPELSDNQKAIIDILTGIHNAEKNYTIKQRGSIYSGNVEIDGTEYKIALHIQPDLEFRLAINGYVTLSKLSYTKDEHDDYTLLHFKQSDNNDKIALTIQVEKSKADDLQKYIGGYTYNPDEIVIYITRTNTGEHSTTGTIVSDDGIINGFSVELPRGTDSECMTSCPDNSKIPHNCYCIMEGTYNFEINTKKYDEGDTKNTSLRIISRVDNNRIGILVHGGRDDAKGWAKGCILPMPKKPIDNCVYGAENRNNSKDESISFVQHIIDWVHGRETEISMRTKKDIKSIPHKIVITKTF